MEDKRKNEEPQLSEKNPNIVTVERPDLEVVFILDRSGSMSGLEADTIGGFNSTLEKQKADGRRVVWSTILFDDVTEMIHDRIDIENVAPLSRREYFVRGMTAMLDAVGGSVNFTQKLHRHLGALKPKSTLFVITTDGMENASVRYRYAQVKQMIDRARSEYGWEFIFLGANIDAEEVASRIGIDRSRAATFINDSTGIETNYGAVSEAMASMACCGSFSEDALESVRADYKKRSGLLGKLKRS